MTIDLKIAYEKLHQLQHQDGDLGAEYWLAVATYLKEAANMRERALSAESKLAAIRDIVNLE